MIDHDPIQDLWQRRELGVGETLQYDIGPLRMWIRFAEHDWYIADQFRNDGRTIYAFERLTSEQNRMPEVEWRRWTSSRASLHVRLSPLLPDRPLVVKPEAEIRIPAGNRALFFVSIPIWVRVSVGYPEEIALAEIPTSILSNSWFGTVTQGELCYSLRTRATREIDMSETMLHRVTCPVHIYNNSATELDFIRLAVHGEFLRLYEGTNRLYTNHVKVTFRGEEHLSQIELSKAAPDIEPGCRLIQHSRVPADQSFMQRTFQVLRSLTGV